jgi:hypothetical protein
MKRWETLTALLAVILASASSLPTPQRLPLAIVAVALLVLVAVSRWQTARKAGKPTASFDSVARAERIREARRSRFH